MNLTATIILWILGIDVTGILITELIHQIKAWKYKFANRHVLITGGSSGLGLELAKRISCEFASVTIIARKKDTLKSAKDEIIDYCNKNGLMTPQIEYEQADVCNRDEIRKAVYNSVKRYGEVDVVICNAGMAKTGYAFGQSISDYQASIDINYMGTVNTLFYTVPAMIKRNSGEVYLVGSTCSMMSYTGYTAYSPSKYAVKGLADSLRLELNRHNIRVGCIYPPNMDTACLQKENETKPAEGLFVEKYFESLFQPDIIASKAVQRIKRGDPHIYCDTDTWGVTLTSSSVGPHNNYFSALLFMIPATICTNAFRWILLVVYKMKRFVGVDKQTKWLAGIKAHELEDTVYTSIYHVS